MKRSNFAKVVDFNYRFGIIPTKDFVPTEGIFDTDPKQVEFCLKLIREEVGELEQAVRDKDYTETVDALTDILYVVYGMGCRIGVNMDRAFDLVHENNMTKLCKTEDEAKRTVEYYLNHPELGYDSPYYLEAPNCDDDMKSDAFSDSASNLKMWVVKNKSTNKVLKSIEWKIVDLSEVTK